MEEYDKLREVLKAWSIDLKGITPVSEPSTDKEAPLVLVSPNIYNQLLRVLPEQTVKNMAAVVDFNDEHCFSKWVSSTGGIQPRLSKIDIVQDYLQSNNPFKNRKDAGTILSRVQAYLNKGMEKQAVNFLVNQNAFKYRKAKLKVNEVKQQMKKDKQLKNKTVR